MKLECIKCNGTMTSENRTGMCRKCRIANCKRCGASYDTSKCLTSKKYNLSGYCAKCTERNRKQIVGGIYDLYGH